MAKYGSGAVRSSGLSSKKNGRVFICAIMALAVVTLACECSGELLGAGADGGPTVTIISPEAGSTVPLNESMTVQVSANDTSGPGVIRVDLLVDDVTIDTFEGGGPQASLTANLTFVPTAEGAISVSAVAYREDGTASSPATIALMVSGESTGASSGEGEAAEASEGSEAGEVAEPGPSVSSDVRVEAQAKMDVPIRQQCGPGCPQIGVWQEDETGDFLIRTTSPTEWWYWTDYLGEDELGCVYQGQEARNFTLLEDDSVLPREPEQGCLFCGDGLCSAEISEECDVCVPDCGVCPFCGDGVVNQDSEECDSGGCSGRQVCNASCLCEPLPVVCGDGIVEGDETCDPPNPPDIIPCGETVEYCNNSCQIEVGTAGCDPGPFCGDGICNESDPCSCSEDCGPC